MENSNPILRSSMWVDEERHISVKRKIRKSTATLHMHEYYEIELIVGGYGNQNLNGLPYELKPGTLYFLSPVDFHEVVPKEQLELINISFDGTIASPLILNALINYGKNLILHLDSEQLKTAMFLAELIEKTFPLTDEFASLNAKNLLETLLIYILRQSETKAVFVDETEIAPIYRSLQYLFLHFTESPTLDDVAKISGYTKTYFSKRFHDLIGKTYIEFLVMMKLKYAKMLLVSTKKTVIEISYLCGFSSLSNFNRVFKQDNHISPTEYRLYAKSGEKKGF